MDHEKDASIPPGELPEYHDDTMAAFPQHEQSMTEHGRATVFFITFPQKSHTIIFTEYDCLHKSAPFHVRGNYTRLGTAGGEGPWVPSWTLLSEHPSSISIYSTY